jgi:beta-galactosidase
MELCDRMGFVVMDEAFDEWKDNKTSMGYGRFFDKWSDRDIRDLVRRDRNHPSVVLWSIANEIPEQSASNGGAMSKRLADFVRNEDSTRPITAGRDRPWDDGTDGAAGPSGFANALDVFAINHPIGKAFAEAMAQLQKNQPKKP